MYALREPGLLSLEKERLRGVYPQLSQPLLVGKVLQSLDDLGGPPLESLQYGGRVYKKSKS